MDSLAAILDEVIWGLHSRDSLEALGHFESIKDIIRDLEFALEANEIPKEVRVI